MDGHTNGVAPLAQIVIELDHNMSVKCQFAVPNRLIMNGMLETAKQTMLAEMTKRESQANGLVVAPPGSSVPRL